MLFTLMVFLYLPMPDHLKLPMLLVHAHFPKSDRQVQRSARRIFHKDPRDQLPEACLLTFLDELRECDLLP